MGELPVSGSTALGRRMAAKALKTVILYAVLCVLTLTMLLPFLWMVSASLQMDKDVFRFPFRWIPKEPRWKNYRLIWERVPFLTFILNTAKLTVIITALQIVTSSLAAYAFARLRFKGRDVIFLGYVATIAIPWQVYMVPQFIMMRRLGLNDSHAALVLLQAFTAFGVFLMRQFFISIPKELSEAARIDGLNDLGIYARIMMPLAKPGLAPLTICRLVTVWHDIMGPLIYLSAETLTTIQLGLRMFIAQYSAEYALLLAASLVSLMPVILLFVSLQRFFVQGVASSGVKG